jgi:hypothetical protein
VLGCGFQYATAWFDDALIREAWQPKEDAVMCILSLVILGMLSDDLGSGYWPEGFIISTFVVCNRH